MNRHLDGVYWRIERDGKWQSICMSDMTEEERHIALEDRDKDVILRILDHVCIRLKYIGDLYDLEGRIE